MCLYIGETLQDITSEFRCFIKYLHNSSHEFSELFKLPIVSIENNSFWIATGFYLIQLKSKKSSTKAYNTALPNFCKTCYPGDFSELRVGMLEGILNIGTCCIWIETDRGDYFVYQAFSGLKINTNRL